MPPSTLPKPVRVLDALATALALPDGGSNYYHAVKFAGYGLDITAPALVGYPAVFIGDTGDIGRHTETSRDNRVLWHGRWWWDLPVYGVINDVGGGNEAYRSLIKLTADIYRAVLVDYTLGGEAINAEVVGWQLLGPQEQTDGKPWVGVLVRVFFQTDDKEMVT